MCAAYSDAQVQQIIAERDGLYQTLGREVAKLASATTRAVEAEAERDRLRALVRVLPHDVLTPLDARGCCAACHEPMDHEYHRLQMMREELSRLRALVARMREELIQQHSVDTCLRSPLCRICALLDQKPE